MIDTLVRRVKAAVVLAVLAAVALALAGQLGDGGMYSRPEWGPEEPNYDDPDRRCTNLVLIVETVFAKHDIDRDLVRVNVEATLGSAGSFGRTNLRLYDSNTRKDRPPFRHEFCAKSGDWLHADVILMPDEPDVSDLSCTFSQGPRFEEDDITAHRADPQAPMMRQTWCDAVAP